jgi:hypothetical protein
MKEDDTFQNTLAHEALRRIPGVGQLQANLVYGETGIPSVDVVAEPIKQAINYATATGKPGRVLAGTKAVFGGLEASGVPASSQVSDIVQGLERAKMFEPHVQKLQDQTGVAPQDMSLRDRLVAERKMKASQPEISKDEQAKAAERNISNIAKRGDEVTQNMSKADRNWLESRGLALPGYDNKLKMGGTTIYLTDEETKQLGGYVQEKYTAAIAKLRSNKSFDSYSSTQRDAIYDATMLAARTAARAQITRDISRVHRTP